MNAYSYLRVSSKGQIDGDGFDRQREAVQRYADKHGVEIVAEFAEAHTGTEAERPEFGRMLSQMGNSGGVNTIVVESMDRFARDMLVQIVLLGNLINKGYTLISATTEQDVTASMSGDPMLKAFVVLQAIFSETEKVRLVQKMKHAREKIRAAGRKCEGCKTNAERHPAEYARLLDAARAMREDRKTYAEVAAEFNAQGWPRLAGKGDWTANSVRQLLGRKPRKRATPENTPGTSEILSAGD